MIPPSDQISPIIRDMSYLLLWKFPDSDPIPDDDTHMGKDREHSKKKLRLKG